MNICIECKHIIRSQTPGSSNVGCGKVTVDSVCDPVTGEVVSSGLALGIDETVDALTASMTFYARCHDVNKGDCKLFERAAE